MQKTLKQLTCAAFAVGALASCNEYVDYTEGSITSSDAAAKEFLAEKLPEYTNAFENQFGPMDPTQDWGMDEEIGVIGAFSSPRTRAGVVDVNRNMWTKFSSGNKHLVDFPEYNKKPTRQVEIPDYDEDALGHDIQIPGWPHLNGLYYSTNGNAVNGSYRGDEIGSQWNPAGDVTPYEIQYVSNWFRTHRNPKTNVNLHLSDFFIQNVSCDYDQMEYKTTGYDLYKEGWPMTGNNGANIKDWHEVGGLTNKDGGPYATNLSENISYDLDNLGFKDMDDEWTHVNNFNRGNSNFSPEDNSSNPNREIKLIKSSGTEGFRCHPSWCTETEWIESWVLVRLTWVETVKDTKSPYPVGTEIPREGYYLAFDFHGEKQGQGGNQVVNQDGYYSNWIVKITPAYFTPTGNSRRIFCEDLGGSFDFDFNDAVVDVAFEQNGSEYIPIISVQAAGGTMPIYVEKHGDERYELHKMLDADVTTPVNVDNTKSHVPAIYRGNAVSSTNAGQISICVDNTNNSVHYQIAGTEPDEEGDERSEIKVGGSGVNLNGSDYKDKTKIAPRAFSAPTSVKWMKELKNIELAYEDFPKWVGDKTYKNSVGAKWYEVAKDAANLLYTSTFIPEKDNPTGGGGYDEDINWTPLTPDPAVAEIVAEVKADSWLRINAYTGIDAIKTKLNGMDDNDRVTFVYVLSSNTMYSSTGVSKLQGIMVPADIDNESRLWYNETNFTLDKLNPVNNATLVEGNHEFSEDGDENTYTLQFSFSKADMINSTHTDSDNPYHDYVLLYLKVGDYAVGTGNHDVNIRKIFVHY